VAEGAALIALGIALLAALGSPAGIAPVLLGGWLLARQVRALRKIRRGPRRAYQLNA
jgi:hypothetical protein